MRATTACSVRAMGRGVSPQVMLGQRVEILARDGWNYRTENRACRVNNSGARRGVLRKLKQYHRVRFRCRLDELRSIHVRAASLERLLRARVLQRRDRESRHALHYVQLS